jgi:hypothetical protein
MATPFDKVIKDIEERGYHNHRLEDHSDTVSSGIFDDLLKTCDVIREDYNSGIINRWFNVPTPGARHRKIDLLVGQQLPNGKPDLEKMRICIENKSVITAHRNKDARFDDLNETLQVLYRVQPEAILVASVLIGMSERVLNVPDKIKPFYKKRMSEFDESVLPRLSTGDASLWGDFDWAVSENRPKDPEQTADKFRQLAVRAPSYTHKVGYDYVLLVPVAIDNVNPPKLARRNNLGLNIDEDYRAMLEHICKTYRARWHL